MGFSIAIDGPAGAGKSTIAKAVAKKLGFIYVDTGAMYRAMALYLLRKNIKGDNKEAISESCQYADITIDYIEGEQQVLLNGENVTSYIRAEKVGDMASASSSNKEVRLKLVELQRALADKADVVMDGRDIGTYVLPQADIKIFLTASTHIRAERRFLELTNKRMVCDLEDIEASIIERDTRDMGREFAPLRQAEDAVFIDTSHMKIEEVINTIISIFENKQRK